MASTRETILAALLARLSALPATTLRGEVLPERIPASGSIAAWEEVVLGVEISGQRVASVDVEVGDVVRKGQVLAEFARETTQADSLQSRASLMQAEASFENAKADADRARSIQDSGALSASQVAQYLTQEKVALAQWEAAKAALGATEVRLGNTRVMAPDDGVISARAATVGAVRRADERPPPRGSRMPYLCQ